MRLTLICQAVLTSKTADSGRVRIHTSYTNVDYNKKELLCVVRRQATSLLDPIFFKENDATVTINGNRHLNMLQNKAPVRNMWFQQDGATPHDQSWHFYGRRLETGSFRGLAMFRGHLDLLT
jgi:hypothetical protein